MQTNGVSCKQPHKSHGLHFWVSRSCTIRSPCLQHCSINSVGFAEVEELEMTSLSIRRKQPYAEGATLGTSEEQPAARSLLALAVSCKLHETDLGRGVLIPADIRSALSCHVLRCPVMSCLVLSRLGGKSAARSVRTAARLSAVGLAWGLKFTSCTSCRPRKRPSRLKVQCRHMTVSVWTPYVECMRGTLSEAALPSCAAGSQCRR